MGCSEGGRQVERGQSSGKYLLHELLESGGRVRLRRDSEKGSVCKFFIVYRVGQQPFLWTS